MLSPDQLNQIRIGRCLHLGKNTAASKVGERIEAFSNSACAENLHKLHDALMDYWAVTGTTTDTEAEIKVLIGFLDTLLKQKTHLNRSQILYDFANLACSNTRFWEIVIESLKQST